jgi:hypothetical protein
MIRRRPHLYRRSRGQRNRCIGSSGTAALVRAADAHPPALLAFAPEALVRAEARRPPKVPFVLAGLLVVV